MLQRFNLVNHWPLVLSIVMALVIGLVLWSFSSNDSTFDIQLHDTYFVMEWSRLWYQITMMIVCLIFILAQLHHRFKVSASLIGLLLSALLLQLVLLKLTNTLAELRAIEWNGLGLTGLDSSQPQFVDNRATKFYKEAIFKVNVVRASLLVLMLFSAFQLIRIRLQK